MHPSYIFIPPLFRRMIDGASFKNDLVPLAPLNASPLFTTEIGSSVEGYPQTPQPWLLASTSSGHVHGVWPVY